MKITKIIALASMAMLLYACEKDKVLTTDSLEESSVSLKDLALQSAGSDNSFIVITKTNKLDKNIEKAIGAVRVVLRWRAL